MHVLALCLATCFKELNITVLDSIDCTKPLDTIFVLPSSLGISEISFSSCCDRSVTKRFLDDEFIKCLSIFHRKSGRLQTVIHTLVVFLLSSLSMFLFFGRNNFPSAFLTGFLIFLHAFIIFPNSFGSCRLFQNKTVSMINRSI